MLYTVIDVETTGRSHRLTEISIFKMEDDQVIDEYTSLVNPQQMIPPYITALTGIDDAMLDDAPIFEEIAQDILDFTEDCVFVAHSVNFDFSVLRGEFKRLGMSFSRKKLCTVRLSRKLFPGLRSYSLGKLCADRGIPIRDRHRARGDCEATVVLFQQLLAQDPDGTVFDRFLNARSREATLPARLPREVFEALPHAPGIYYFRDKKGKALYVGKAKDIKKRVLQHFYDKKKKELDLCRETRHIDFELSGNELVALLMEDAAIKKHYPPFNVVSKRMPKAYALFSYTDRAGIVHLAYNGAKGVPEPLVLLYSLRQCRLYLEELCEKFDLCPKYCHLQENVIGCSHFSLQNCQGVCRGEETPKKYNKRVARARAYIRESTENLVLKEPGRHVKEEAFVWIQDGSYRGYGFVERTETVVREEQLEAFLIPQQDNRDVQQILRGWLRG